MTMGFLEWVIVGMVGLPVLTSVPIFETGSLFSLPVLFCKKNKQDRLNYDRSLPNRIAVFYKYKFCLMIYLSWTYSYTNFEYLLLRGRSFLMCSSQSTINVRPDTNLLKEDLPKVFLALVRWRRNSHLSHILFLNDCMCRGFEGFSTCSYPRIKIEKFGCYEYLIPILSNSLEKSNLSENYLRLQTEMSFLF